MRAKSAFAIVLLALCFLALCQAVHRSKRTKITGKERAHCHLTSDPGSCPSKYRRWFYDVTTGDCKTFFWTGCGGNDNRFRSRGQCERSCKVGGQNEDEGKPKHVAKCRRLPCKGLRCLHGYDHGLDDNGCQTCRCRSLPTTATTAAPPVEVCPQVDCPGKFCPKGFRLDDRNCLTCQCQGCPPLDCPPQLNCGDRYVVDEQSGCEICGCSGAHAPERPHTGSEEALPVAEKALTVLGKAVPDLKVEDKNLLISKEAFSVSKNALPVSGKALPADSVQPRASKSFLPVPVESTSCPYPAECYLQCSDGFAVDAAGCQLCACQQYVRAALPGDEFRCRPMECEISCEGGYKTDENGCEICSCAGKSEKNADRKRKCPRVTCSPQCGLNIDDTGCQVCSCKDDHNVTGCDVTALAACRLYCPGGYDRDSRGCEICECRPLADERSPDGAGDFVTCAPLDELGCAERCEFFVILQDKNDCEVCECAASQSRFTTPVTGTECPALVECTLECPEALERDEKGCEICICRKAGVETGNAVPVEKEEEEEDKEEEKCPAIECPLPCRLVADGRCSICRCDEPPEVDATPTGVTCPEVECAVMSCPGGFRLDNETGCQLCACVDERQTLDAIAVTSDPFATPDSAEEETDEISSTPDVTSSDEATTPAAPVTRPTDLDGSSTTTTGYPAEAMCSGRKCEKKCINGLRKRESEECFLCECNSESRPSKRLVDVNVFNARKGTCSLPAYKGPCHATIERWYFNYQTGACEMFEYGGCRGYANNFQSQESCVEFCRTEVNQDLAKRQEWIKEVLGF